jgi:hypothetical protein
MNSPRYPPAGLLVRCRRCQIMLDGGPGAEPGDAVAAWLVTDERSELRRELRTLAGERGLQPLVAAIRVNELSVEPHAVAHTSHPTWGYLLRTPTSSVAWGPEFWTFPAWAAGVDLMFADAAGWNRPIRFAGGVGGHMAALDVADQARQRGVNRLVFAHIGRPSLRAIDAGHALPFGEWGQPGRTYQLPRLPRCIGHNQYQGDERGTKTDCLDGDCASGVRLHWRRHRRLADGPGPCAADGPGPRGLRNLVHQMQLD